MRTNGSISLAEHLLAATVPDQHAIDCGSLSVGVLANHCMPVRATFAESSPVRPLAAELGLRVQLCDHRVAEDRWPVSGQEAHEPFRAGRLSLWSRSFGPHRAESAPHLR